MPARQRSTTRRVVLLVVGAAIVVAAAWLGAQAPDWLDRMSHPLKYPDLIASESKAAGLDPYVVAALINVESKFRPDVTSSAGAVGLMQVKPSTAHAVAADAGLPERVTAATLERPGTNVRVGARYLSYLVRRYGDLQLALAAYNAGMTNVDRWVATSKSKGSSFVDEIEFPSTRYYVSEVDKQADTYRRLYPGAFGATSK